MLLNECDGQKKCVKMQSAKEYQTLIFVFFIIIDAAESHSLEAEGFGTFLVDENKSYNHYNHKDSHQYHCSDGSWGGNYHDGPLAW